MDKFCVITNAEKDKEYEMAMCIASFLQGKGKECFLVRDRFIEEHAGRFAEISEIPEDTDCIIVLGGDGTMIQAANDLYSQRIPLLGVNLGTLGFLTEVEVSDIAPSLEDLFQDMYKVESRIMLEGTLFDQQRQGTALNDFVISKSGSCRMIQLLLYVDNEFIDMYAADGIVISTPTGSTGYNLSAGGPVLAPEVKAIVITPICPHSLNNRSLVVDSDSKIMVKVGQTKENGLDEAVVAKDGNEIVFLKTGEYIELTKASEDAKIIKLENFHFFERLRKKLGMGQ